MKGKILRLLEKGKNHVQRRPPKQNQHQRLPGEQLRVGADHRADPGLPHLPGPLLLPRLLLPAHYSGGHRRLLKSYWVSVEEEVDQGNRFMRV